MKNLHFYSIVLIIFFSFISCNKENLFSQNGDNLALKEKENTKLDIIPYLLTYNKETYSFKTKKEMLTFLAANEKSARYFYYEWVLMDLNEKYKDKYGQGYSKDNSLIDQLTQDFIDEATDDEITVDPELLYCLRCQLGIGICYTVEDFQQGITYITLFEEKNFEGAFFKIIENKFVAKYSCKEPQGLLEIPSLSFNGADWDNRISSFKFRSEVLYRSLLLTFYSKTDMIGSEHSYFLTASENEKNEYDLSEYFWINREFPISVDNNISSIKVQMNDLQAQ